MARQTGMKGLQLWCKNVTQGYKGVEIKDMNKSFRDGLAFCAIIHHYRPDLIPFDTLKKGDVARNNALAFKIAEEELDIPALLDVEDMVDMEIPDKLSIATYLISYYNYFKDKQPAPPTNNIIPKPQQTSNASTDHNNSSSTNKSSVFKPRDNIPKSTSAPTIIKPQLAKTVSSPPATNEPAVHQFPKSTNVSKDNAVSKLSEGLLKLQKKEMGVARSPTHKPPGGDAAPVKKSLTPSVSMDPVPSATPPLATPPSTNKSGVRGRRQKFNSIKSSEDKTVATDTVKPVVAQLPPPKPPSRRKSEKRKSVVHEICEICEERVFLMQRLCAEGHIYHRQCFKCAKCNTGLQSKSYEYDIHCDKFYCRLHYQEINRNKSIKRNMIARGVTDYTDNEIELASMDQNTSNGHSDGNERNMDEWDIISTPPPTQKTAPPTIALEQTNDDHIKKELPSLLSELAQKKRHDLVPTEAHPKPHPQPDSKADKQPMIPNPKSRPITPPTDQPTNAKAPPTNISSTNNHSPNLSNRSSDNNIVRDSNVGGSPRLPPMKPPPPRTNKQPDADKKPCPPKPVRTGSTKFNKVKMLEHYEFSPQYYKENNEANEILKERYEIPETTSHPPAELEECSPYEVPISKERSLTELQPIQPPKPPRPKRPGYVTIHKGDTWIKPYATTALHEAGKQNGKDGGDKPVIRAKPIRPAPPAPYRPKQKPSSSVSPYAISEVQGVISPTNNELKKKRQRELSRYKMELESIDKDREQVERRGVELETRIRTAAEQGNEQDEDQLIEMWFSLVNEKDQFVKRECELVYLIRDIELILQKERLEVNIRKRLAKDDSTKTTLERAEEDTMLEELNELVMRRDQLMWQFDEDKNRTDESEMSITRAMTGITSN